MAFERLTHHPVVAPGIDQLAAAKSNENARLNRALSHMRISTGNAIPCGLLDDRAREILSMANAQGQRLVRRSALEGWVTLILERPD